MSPWSAELGTSIHSTDAHGRVYLADGTVRRVVSPESYTVFSGLARSGGLDRLHQAGLVQTRVLPVQQVDGQPVFALEHERLPFVSYPQEWTIGMLRDAGLCTLNVALALHREGLHLYDAHGWNVTFRHGRAVYLDASSIATGPALEPWWPEEYFYSFYAPVKLRTIRMFRRYLWPIAELIATSEHPFADPDCPRARAKQLMQSRRLGRFAFSYWRRAKRFRHARGTPEATLTLLADLRRRLSAMEIRSRRSEWGKYNEPGGAFDRPETFSPKARAVACLLQGLPPGRVVDLACNRGWFSGLAASMGHTVLGVEIDANALEAGRPLALERRIDLACMNVIWPTPPQGRALCYPSAVERFACDTLLMIALQHHLVLRQRVSFRSLAAIAASYGPQNLIIEWIPADDVYVKEWPTELGLRIPDWYGQEQFVAAFSQHFPRHRSVPSGEGHTDFRGPTNRVMYLFQR